MILLCVIVFIFIIYKCCYYMSLISQNPVCPGTQRYMNKSTKNQTTPDYDHVYDDFTESGPIYLSCPLLSIESIIEKDGVRILDSKSTYF